MIRSRFILGYLLLCPASAVMAQISIGVSLPHVSIGIDVPAYPELVPRNAADPRRDLLVPQGEPRSVPAPDRAHASAGAT